MGCVCVDGVVCVCVCVCGGGGVCEWVGWCVCVGGWVGGLEGGGRVKHNLHFPDWI